MAMHATIAVAAWLAALAQGSYLALHGARGGECHRRKMHSLVFSPDEAYGLTASEDNTAKLWNVSSGELIRTFDGHGDGVVSAAFSPNGSLVLTASKDCTAKLWHASTGECLGTFGGPEGHTMRVNSAVFSPDGAFALTSSKDSTVKLWNVASRTVVRTLQAHREDVISASFSRTVGRAITACGDSTAAVWDIATGNVKVLFLPLHETYARDGDRSWEHGWTSELSRDGDVAVTQHGDETARIWDVAAGRLRAVLGLFVGQPPVLSAALSHDGKFVLTHGRGPTKESWEARLWWASNGAEHKLLDVSKERYTTAVFSADREYALTVAGEGLAKVWNARSWRLAWSVQLPRAAFSPSGTHISAAFSPSGTRILAPSEDGKGLTMASMGTVKWTRGGPDEAPDG